VTPSQQESTARIWTHSHITWMQIVGTFLIIKFFHSTRLFNKTYD